MVVHEQLPLRKANTVARQGQDRIESKTRPEMHGADADGGGPLLRDLIGDPVATLDRTRFDAVADNDYLIANPQRHQPVVLDKSKQLAVSSINREQRANGRHHFDAETRIAQP